MTVLNIFVTFLQDIISYPDYAASTTALQLQIKHLLFLATIADTEDWETVIEEHNMILDDVKNGLISWNNLDYFTQWQSKIVNLINSSKTSIDDSNTFVEEEDEIKNVNDNPNHLTYLILEKDEPSAIKDHEIDRKETREKDMILIQMEMNTILVRGKQESTKMNQNFKRK